MNFSCAAVGIDTDSEDVCVRARVRPRHRASRRPERCIPEYHPSDRNRGRPIEPRKSDKRNCLDRRHTCPPIACARNSGAGSPAFRTDWHDRTVAAQGMVEVGFRTECLRQRRTDLVGARRELNRAGGIRTRDLLHPRQALYQAEPQPEPVAVR